MIREADTLEKPERFESTAKNLFIHASLRQGRTYLVFIVCIFVCVAAVFLFVGLWDAEHRKRVFAEENQTLYFFPDGSGYYRRQSVMPETHILAFIDRYLATRLSWSPNTVEVNIEAAKRITHSKLLKTETTNGDYDAVKTLAQKRVAQSIRRLEQVETRILSTEYGYVVMLSVLKQRSTLQKIYEEETIPMCIALVQVDPSGLDWGLQVGAWKEHCTTLKT